MPQLITTPAAADANSYASLAEADAYHDARVHSDVWLAASSSTRQAALMMATRVLDAIYEWNGFATTTTQALQWPRTGLEDAKRRSFIDELALPNELKNATAELARQLIAEDRTADSDIETKGLKFLKAGPVAMSFSENVVAKVVPDAVMSLLPPWWGFLRSRVSMDRELMRA